MKEFFLSKIAFFETTVIFAVGKDIFQAAVNFLETIHFFGTELSFCAQECIFCSIVIFLCGYGCFKKAVKFFCPKVYFSVEK